MLFKITFLWNECLSRDTKINLRPFKVMKYLCKLDEIDPQKLWLNSTRALKKEFHFKIREVVRAHVTTFEYFVAILQKKFLATQCSYGIILALNFQTLTLHCHSTYCVCVFTKYCGCVISVNVPQYLSYNFVKVNSRNSVILSKTS